MSPEIDLRLLHLLGEILNLGLSPYDLNRWWDAKHQLTPILVLNHKSQMA